MRDEQNQAVESLGSTRVSAQEPGPNAFDASISQESSQKADGDVNKDEPTPASELDPRHCEHFSGDGKRCKGWKVSGSGYCAGHSGLGVAASPEAAAAAARQSAVVRQEKAQIAKRRAVEVYREAVEEHAEAFVAARLQIINNRAAPAGDRLRAMEQLESRALGKPKETIEQVNEEPEELQAMRAMSPEARRILLRQMNEAERQARSSSEH